MVGVEGTSIAEVHNFKSCGLYGMLWSDYLIQPYVDGINYLKNDNKLLEIWSEWNGGYIMHYCYVYGGERCLNFHGWLNDMTIERLKNEGCIIEI